MRKNYKLVGALAVAGLVATGGSAFTAANTGGTSKAGAVTTAISGYAISGVTYTPNATTPTDLDSVTFTLDATAAYVAVKTHSAGTWVKSNDLRLTAGTVNSCTAAGNVWTCDLTGLSETVAGADNLSVVATT